MEIILLILSFNIGAKCYTPREEDTVVFGHVGGTIDLHSHMTDPLNQYGVTSWYHETHGGRIQVKFSEYYTRSAVVTAQWSNVSYTINNLTVMDSGRYFAAERKGNLFITGSSMFLIVTDNRLSPMMRVFDGPDGSTGPREFLCEVQGAGSGWSDPFWVIEQEGRKTDVRQQTQSRLNEVGAFLRWTGISLPVMENSMRKVLCVCLHDTGDVVQVTVMDGDEGASVSSCDLLFVFVPLCVLIPLFTVVFMRPWIHRACSQRDTQR
ncbi:uncharacterized protein LOC121720788 [Alosa sapidissima]|uniref:uncharacterized protein LOC121720788 n=1 Tax=Alosa sapidissima TaxID=34773 RepID=UPI001C08762C|nr:uncharacterized protein LOC121720788 [Alosa sapidissima]